jgi:hypothetical protein
MSRSIAADVLLIRVIPTATLLENYENSNSKLRTHRDWHADTRLFYDLLMTSSDHKKEDYKSSLVCCITTTRWLYIGKVIERISQQYCASHPGREQQTAKVTSEKIDSLERFSLVSIFSGSTQDTPSLTAQNITCKLKCNNNAYIRSC